MKHLTRNFAQLCAVILLLASSFSTPLFVSNKAAADVPTTICQAAVGDSNTGNPLAAPTLLTPSNDSTDPNAFDFSWTSVSGAAQYDWESSLTPSLNADGSFASQLGYHRLDTTSINEGNSPQATYYWHVRAVASDGTTGAWSQTWQVAINDTQASYLGAPALLSPISGAACDIYAQDFDFVWNAPTSDGGLSPLTYVFQSGRSAATDPLTGEFTDQPWTDNNIAATSISDGNSASATYYWHIRAVASDGTLGPWSATWVVTINHDAPIAPIVTPTTPAPPADNTGNPATTNPASTPSTTPAATPVSTTNASSSTPTVSLFTSPSTSISTVLGALGANPSVSTKVSANKTPQPVNLAADYTTIHGNQFTRDVIWAIIALAMAFSAAIFAFRRRHA